MPTNKHKAEIRDPALEVAKRGYFGFGKSGAIVVGESSKHADTDRRDSTAWLGSNHYVSGDEEPFLRIGLVSSKPPPKIKAKRISSFLSMAVTGVVASGYSAFAKAHSVDRRFDALLVRDPLRTRWWCEGIVGEQVTEFRPPRRYLVEKSSDELDSAFLVTDRGERASPLCLFEQSLLTEVRFAALEKAAPKAARVHDAMLDLQTALDRKAALERVAARFRRPDMSAEALRERVRLAAEWEAENEDVTAFAGILKP